MTTNGLGEFDVCGVIKTDDMLPLHNQVQLIGRAGHDVELLTLSDGTYRASLRLYQNTRSAAGAEDRQAYPLIAWNQVATQLEARVRRGDRVLVQGRLVNRQIRSGDQHLTRTEVHLSAFTVLTSRSVTRAVGILAEPTPEKYSHE